MDKRIMEGCSKPVLKDAGAYQNLNKRLKSNEDQMPKRKEKFGFFYCSPSIMYMSETARHLGKNIYF
ncbi:hypothetical protein [Halobacillus andaensis]|uniref:hypothetical protein n=1 Tax=Halobacillus andaensis TaxID=1176239 RepID=UPI003D75F038